MRSAQRDRKIAKHEQERDRDHDGVIVFALDSCGEHRLDEHRLQQTAKCKHPES
jgi:hypothetical protein